MGQQPRVDLAQLRALCLAVELGSLGRAARVMGISQPALSKRIRELEAVAGAALLIRSPVGVSPTPAGDRLYREGRALLTHSEVFAQLLGDMRGERAPIRLAASHTIAEFVLAEPLAAYRERSGHRVAIELVSANSLVVGDLVRERRADIGLAAAMDDEDRQRGLAVSFLCDDEVVVAVPHGHPWAGLEIIALSDFLRTSMVMRDPSSNSRRVLAATLAAQGLSAAAPVAEVGSTAVAIAAAVSERVPTVLSARAVAATSSLEAVRVVGLPLRRQFVLVTHADAVDPLPVEHLAAYLRTAIS